MYICLNALISISKFYDKDNLYEVEENSLDDWWFATDFQNGQVIFTIAEQNNELEINQLKHWKYINTNKGILKT